MKLRTYISTLLTVFSLSLQAETLTLDPSTTQTMIAPTGFVMMEGLDFEIQGYISLNDSVIEYDIQITTAGSGIVVVSGSSQYSLAQNGIVFVDPGGALSSLTIINEFPLTTLMQINQWRLVATWKALNAFKRNTD